MTERIGAATRKCRMWGWMGSGGGPAPNDADAASAQLADWDAIGSGSCVCRPLFSVLVCASASAEDGAESRAEGDGGADARVKCYAQVRPSVRSSRKPRLASLGRGERWPVCR